MREFCHFFPLTANIWASLYALENNELLTSKWWESNIRCCEGPAGSALWETMLSTKVFLGNGADCQPGCICSSDCFGNVSNVSQNGRSVREEDRASCWAMAITNLRLNVSYYYLHGQVSENAPLDMNFLVTCSCSAGNSDRHIPVARSFFFFSSVDHISCSICCVRRALVTFWFTLFFLLPTEYESILPFSFS